ncbi:hypothetical protein CSUI_003867 [Cystoisospora suis]|uniref:Uncharacterized protein n=1 Tax=Cystoisospora suis TaxID=483139 RepID=A0A2C6L399_9APIC|nr:hypothetical protein CSUI_003867 [Cystoisospora suis]
MAGSGAAADETDPQERSFSVGTLPSQKSTHRSQPRGTPDGSPLSEAAIARSPDSIPTPRAANSFNLAGRIGEDEAQSEEGLQPTVGRRKRSSLSSRRVPRGSHSSLKQGTRLASLALVLAYGSRLLLRVSQCSSVVDMLQIGVPRRLSDWEPEFDSGAPNLAAVVLPEGIKGEHERQDEETQHSTAPVLRRLAEGEDGSARDESDGGPGPSGGNALPGFPGELVPAADRPLGPGRPLEPWEECVASLHDIDREVLEGAQTDEEDEHLGLNPKEPIRLAVLFHVMNQERDRASRAACQLWSVDPLSHQDGRARLSTVKRLLASLRNNIPENLQSNFGAVDKKRAEAVANYVDLLVRTWEDLRAFHELMTQSVVSPGRYSNAAGDGAEEASPPPRPSVIASVGRASPAAAGRYAAEGLREQLKKREGAALALDRAVRNVALRNLDMYSLTLLWPRVESAMFAANRRADEVFGPSGAVLKTMGSGGPSGETSAALGAPAKSDVVDLTSDDESGSPGEGSSGVAPASSSSPPPAKRLRLDVVDITSDTDEGGDMSDEAPAPATVVTSDPDLPSAAPSGPHADVVYAPSTAETGPTEEASVGTLPAAVVSEPSGDESDIPLQPTGLPSTLPEDTITGPPSRALRLQLDQLATVFRSVGHVAEERILMDAAREDVAELTDEALLAEFQNVTLAFSQSLSLFLDSGGSLEGPAPFVEAREQARSSVLMQARHRFLVSAALYRCFLLRIKSLLEDNDG